MSLQVQGRIQQAPIFNTDGSINAGSVGLFAVGPCGADDVAIRRAATVKISTALQHHQYSTVAVQVPSRAALQDNKKRKGKAVADREEAGEDGDGDDNNDAPEDEAERAAAEVHKFYPMKESPQALRCEHIFNYWYFTFMAESTLFAGTYPPEFIL